MRAGCIAGQDRTFGRTRNKKMKGYLITAGAVFAADAASKAYIRKNVPEGREPVQLGNSGISIQHLENPGFAGGRCGKKPEEVQAFAAGSMAVLLPAWLLMLARPGHGLSKAGWSLTLGGGLGNLADRMLRGTVTDFIRIPSLKPEAVGRIVFNGADAAICAGLALNVVSYLADNSESSRKQK